MMKIRLPHNLKPRKYQIPFLRAVDRGIKRVILVWPRRHGKDKICFNGLIKQAMLKTGNYYYIFPEYNQGRKALWDNIDNDGFRTIKHIPKEIIVGDPNSTEMKAELINGSIVQIIGAKDIDRIVGTNPQGVVFSEYSLVDPMVWGYLLPILRNNGGFAWFNFTPRGDNHAKILYQNNINKSEWFVEKLVAKDCGVYNDRELEEIRNEYYELYGDYELYDQEFNTSFTAPMQGSYYGKIMSRAEEEGRVTSVPYDASVPVHVAWDLGYNDANALWFYQNVGKEIHIIDYYENSGESLGHYVNEMNKKPYIYGTNYLPHDANAHELQTGKTRSEALKSLGVTRQVILKGSSRADGIEVVRSFLSRCWFDAKKCERGIQCLKNYRKEFDTKRKVFRNSPDHDWSSNGADAFRYLAQSWRRENGEKNNFRSRKMSRRINLTTGG